MAAAEPTGVVVGYDGSPSAALAVSWAVEEAERTGQKVTILRAMESEEDLRLLSAGVFGAAPALEVNGHEHGEGVIALVGRAGVRRTVIGSASDHLIRSSRTAALVVLGFSGRDPVFSASMGSTALAVAAHARGPVVVVRPNPRVSAAARPGPDRSVVIGADDLEFSRATQETAAKVAADAGATLRIIRAFEAPFVLERPVPGASKSGYRATLRESALAVASASADYGGGYVRRST